MEANVRASGAVPATIGFIDGRVKVGLERHELERLANRVHNPVKVSRRDVAATIATRKDGGMYYRSTLSGIVLS
jgi:pseudouridine-5'-phosphate glycosidase/pseudouridine kinase